MKMVFYYTVVLRGVKICGCKHGLDMVRLGLLIEVVNFWMPTFESEKEKSS